MNRLYIGAIGFIAMLVGLSSFAENLNAWALLIGVCGVLMVVWSGAFRTVLE